MPAPFDPADAFARLMALSRSASDAGHHEVAYHALMAARHGAEDAGDVDQLGQVAREARGQLAGIDARSPGHHLSSRSSHARGVVSIFETGALTAETAIKRMESERAHAELRRRWADSPPAG